jgi:TRAP transporter TAXI family solute receptor
LVLSNSSRNAFVLYCTMRTRKLRVRTSASAGALFALCLSSALCAAAETAEAPQRIPFQIATGSTTGTYFPVGTLLSEILSHPAGVTRCEAANACGPSGLIVSTLASQGSVANVISVNTGMITSGLAQADVVALAMDGKGPFRKSGPAKNLRVIADLYGEDLHLLAASKSKITSVSELRGKRVSLSPEGSGTEVTARAVLAAYGIGDKAVRPNFDSPEDAAELMRKGRLDALFLVGGVPSKVAEELIADNVAHLVPLTGPGAKKLLKDDPYLDPHSIPKGAYGNTPEVETVSVDALWITGESQPENLIYGILKALYNPANRPAIQQSRQGTHFIEASYGAKPAPAPPHAGALRFFSEQGLIKPTAKDLPARPAGKKT